MPVRYPLITLGLILATAACGAGVEEGAIPKADSGTRPEAAISLIKPIRVTQFAASGLPGYVDGDKASAEFAEVMGIAMGRSYAFYVADAANNRIRLIKDGAVSTVAGSGTIFPDAQGGFSNGATTSAQFNNPSSIAISGDGTLYVADTDNHRIRMIAGGQVSTLAGSGRRGYRDGPVVDAEFNYPSGIALDPSGRIYVADTRNHRIRMIYKGVVSTLAGSGTAGSVSGGFNDGAASSAQFNNPRGVATDGQGKVFVADTENHRIRVIANGEVSTVAGMGTTGQRDGPASSALFSSPTGLALGGTDRIYVVDRGNMRVRMIRRGMVHTVDLNVSVPLALAADADGRLFVSDGGKSRSLWRAVMSPGRTGASCDLEEISQDTVPYYSMDLKTQECGSGVCLESADGTTRHPKPALCATSCKQDVDCKRQSPNCPSGFTCMAPMWLRPCCTVCVCRDYILPGSEDAQGRCDSTGPACSLE